MTNIAKLSLLFTIISVALICYTLVDGNQPLIKAFVNSLSISSVLILLCLATISFETIGKSLKNSVFYYIVLGAFLGCFYFNIKINLMMFPDGGSLESLQTQELGYWMFILVFGSLKPISIGGFIGFLTYLWLTRKSS